MSDFSLQAMFTPNANALADVPQEKFFIISQAYITIAEVMSRIIKQKYKTGALDIAIVPVNLGRVMMRIIKEGQDITQPNNTPPEKDMIGQFIADLNSAFDKEDIMSDIYAAKDQNFYHVLSFRAEDMIGVLRKFASEQPNMRELNSSLDNALHYKRRFAAKPSEYRLH